MNENKKYVVPSSIISAALIISVLIFSLVWKSARTADQTITVTGSAKEAIVSNLGTLEVTLTANASGAKEAFSKIRSMTPLLMDYLKSKGFTDSQIEVFAVDNYPLYLINNQGYQTQTIVGYVYNQRVKIESDDVNKIKDLSLTISELVEQGVSLNSQQPQYLYTKIDELKISVQAKAAANAMERAEQIAISTGRSLGPLRSARMGVIQITPKNSTMISDYGMNDTGSIEKEITAVVSASFSIE